MEPKRFVMSLSGLSIILGLAVIVAGLAGFKNFVYSRILYSVVGSIIAVFSLVLLVRASSSKDNRVLGEATVTYGWWIFSGGVGGLIVYLAPLFNKGHPGASATLLASSLIAIAIGVALLGYAKNRLGASLSV
jgi:hypothetical protein